MQIAQLPDGSGSLNGQPGSRAAVGTALSSGDPGVMLEACDGAAFALSIPERTPVDFTPGPPHALLAQPDNRHSEGKCLIL